MLRSTCFHVFLLLNVLLIVGCSAEKSYLFTAPKVLQDNANTTMCITLFSTLDAGDLNVKVMEEKKMIGEHSQKLPAVPEGKHGITCFPVFVGGASRYYGKLLLQVDFPDQPDYTIEGEREIVFKRLERYHTLVQTDKPLYKPGQLVQFRVLTIDTDLKPLKDQISLVYIESPDGSRLAQWKNVKVKSGLTQLSYQLSEKATKGRWKIHLETTDMKGELSKTSKLFKVEEFVLPKFSVEVKGRSYLLANDKKAVWTVCAKYTYGKPVTGKANITLTNGYRKTPLTSKPLKASTNGCVEFEFSAAELTLGQPYSRVYMIHVTGYFVEDGTGLTQSGKNSARVTSEPVRFDRTGLNSKFFKPGLPFYDKIKVMKPDDTPAPNEKVEFCYRVFSESETGAISRHYYWSDRKNFICANMTSDEDGTVEFGVLERNPKIRTIAISARAVNYPMINHPPNRHGYSPIFMQMPFLSYSIRGWLSDSGSFIQLPTSLKEANCGDDLEVTAIFTAPFGDYDVFYQVISDGDLQLSEKTRVKFTDNIADELLEGEIRLISSDTTNSTDLPTGRVTLTVPSSAVANSEVKLLVFLVIENEVVADGRMYSVQECLPNSVALDWSSRKVRPGQSVDLRLSAAPNSFCGIDVIDKSVLLLGTENRVSAKDLFNLLKKTIIGPYEGISQVNDDEYCTRQYGDPRDNLPGDESASSTTTDSSGEKTVLLASDHRVHAHWKTVGIDSATAFDTLGSVVWSDIKLESRLCEAMAYPRPFLFSSITDDDVDQRFDSPPAEIGLVASVSGGFAAGDAGNNEAEEQESSVRTYFPETWLFEFVIVDDSGEVIMPYEAPDTITEWVGGAICSSEAVGVGVSSSALLTTFQEIFIRYTLPYAVKREEILHLKVSVFNYQKSTLPVRLTLSESDRFKIDSDPVQNVCVGPDKPVVATFLVKPIDLGQVNITVKAEVSPDFENDCDLEQPVSLKFSDTVIRPMLVKPGGFIREETKTNFICIEPDNNELTQNTDDAEVNWELNLPEDTVQGSAYAVISVVGDLLGRGIENIHQLVRLPTGCGEQNMIKFVPNIFVKEYLISTEQLTEKLKDKLIRYLKTGYTRELEYRHQDGSYSAFGKSDKSGSTWLTAFVVRSFSQASKFIEIDQDDINSSAKWLENQQYTSGCFASVGTVLHKSMKGGVSSSGGQALSAYVTASLLISKVPLKKDTLDNAFKCLDQSKSTNIYTLALRGYAYALAGRWTEAKRDYNTLMEKKLQSNGVFWWEATGFESNKALSVEIGSYVILIANLLENSQQVAGDFSSQKLSCVRWISKQMNGKGGFISTQDTVMALAALSAFAAGLPRSDVSKLDVQVSDGEELSETLQVTDENRLLTQQLPLKDEQLPAKIEVAASGTGCALVQYWLTYNVKNASPSDALNITVNTEPVHHRGECLKHILSVCISYKKEGDSNMALVEVEMVSGFIPNKNSLDVLLRNERIGLKRWELDEDKVIFYFDAIGAKPLCFHFRVQQEEEVENVEPGQATVLDYYQPEFSMSTTYKLNTDCPRGFDPVLE